MIFKFLSSLFIFLHLPTSIAYASAGYYPTSIGEIIQIQGCVLAKAKYPLRIYLGDVNGNSILIKQINFLPKKRGDCAKGEIEILAPWRVDRRGDFSLYLKDVRSRKVYWIWPDGIESR